MRELSKGERAVPRAHFGIVNGGAVLVRAGYEVVGKALADFLWRAASGPVAEVVRLGRKRGSSGRKQQGAGDKLDEVISFSFPLDLEQPANSKGRPPREGRQSLKMPKASGV